MDDAALVNRELEALMCRLCQKSVLLLRKKANMTFGQAMGFLWNETPFPIDGELTYRRVRQFLAISRDRRGPWLRKQNRRSDREVETLNAKKPT